MNSETDQLTYVVPTRNSSRTIERCLDSLRSQTHQHAEIIVVDNASDDGTKELAEQFADRVETWGPERSAQRNRGLALASGSIVAFIDSDMYLTSGVASAACAEIRSRRADAVIVPEASVGEGFFAACRAHEKGLYVGNRDVEAARFFLASAVRSIGGYREDLRAGEDWDVSDRFVGAGHSVGRIDDLILHDDGRISLLDMFRKKRYYGESFQHYVATRDCAEVRRLGRPALFTQPGPLIRHPILTSGLLVLKTVETSGLATGALVARRTS